MTPDCHPMQMEEKRKGRLTTTTGLPKYPYGAICAVGESKAPKDVAENARYYREPNHGPAALAPLSHDVVLG